MPNTPVAVVTGASRGLGAALARALAGRGWRLVVDARDAVALTAAWPADGDDAAAPGSVAVVPGDVTDPRHRAELVAAAERLGQPRLLVLNAGGLGPSPLPPLADLELTDLRDLLEVNTVAQLGLVQAALPALRRGGGTVLAVTSDAATAAYPGWGGYGATKAALEQIAAVLTEEEPDVRVWTVDPGDLRTRMHQDAFPGEDIGDRPLPEAVVPRLLRLLDEDLPSGRYTVADLTADRPNGNPEVAA
jgi:NAD(P)-dependent dehydrogenase (short-subunit alcohol dehydrogenase family)